MTELTSIVDTASRTGNGAAGALVSHAAGADDPPVAAPGTPEREHRIREVAYGYFVERGCVEGHDLDDWLKAEAEIEQTCRDDGQGTSAAPVAH